MEVDDDLAEVAREAGRRIIGHVDRRARVLAEIQRFFRGETERSRFQYIEVGLLRTVHED